MKIVVHRIFFKHRALFLVLCLLFVGLQAAKKPTTIFLEQSETLSFDKHQKADCQVLRGNVIFRHDDAYMYCDSAYFYDQNNTIDAFSNIRMEQGDTLFVYSDFLHYDGNTRIANLKGNVQMVNRETILETDSFDYDRNQNKGYYYTGGKIYDGKNTMTSIWGEYSPDTKLAVFRDKVRLINEEFALASNNLHYNTASKTATIVGPSVILYKEKTTIYSEKGSYDTANEQATLYNRSYIEQNDGKRLTADTIFYNRSIGEGTAWGNTELLDTAQHIVVYGNNAFYRELDSYGLVYNSAYAVEYSTANDSLFLHADTLRTYADSVYQVLKAVSNVRFYRSDLQGKCDTLVYSTRDSVLNMYESPVLWSDSAQLAGDFIQVFQQANDSNMVFVQGLALAITQHDSLRFNQLSGKTLKAYIANRKLHEILVEGNAESIYYPIEDDGSIVGINRTESSVLEVFLNNRKINKIVMSPASSGTLYPEEQMPKEKKQLTHFAWYETIRPKNKADIFTRYPLSTKIKSRRRTQK